MERILVSENTLDADKAINILVQSLPLGQSISEATKEAIRESFRLYVNTEAGRRLYGRHKAAIESLNHLSDLFREHSPGQITNQYVSDVFFPLSACVDRFEMPVLDYDTLTAK
ncbi:MAG: hypothetical protein ACOYN4_11425 [Bacteroidales bacterium]